MQIDRQERDNIRTRFKIQIRNVENTPVPVESFTNTRETATNSVCDTELIFYTFACICIIFANAFRDASWLVGTFCASRVLF